MLDLPRIDWILALDLSTRATGWAAGLVTANRPHADLWTLPGMADQGALYGGLRDRLVRWCDRRRPDLIVFCRPFLNKGSIAAEGLGGMAAVLHLFCWDRGIDLRRIDERDARVAVIRPTILKEMAQANRAGGKGSGAGSKLAKAAAMEWAAAAGIEAATHDVADAAVIWEYARRLARPRISKVAA